jgi:Mrp family chromosome partitioning ATPase
MAISEATRRGVRVEAPAAATLNDAKPADMGPLRVDDIVNLHCSVLRALPDVKCRFVEVISAGPGAGVSSIARALATAAATIGNARVLLVDATPKHDDFRELGAVPAAGSSLNDVAAGKIDLRDILEPVRSHNFALCSLADPGVGARVAVNVDALDPALERLRDHFDLVVFDAPAMSHGALGPALTKKVDGVVVVVEAERTRAPVVAELQRVIEVNGGRILGVVLNKRRFHIPRFLYRWL